MEVQTLLQIMQTDFYTGVPDSQLKALCDCLIDTYGIDPQHHIIAANEGNAAALAAGYHLATGKVPVVYMQNSGEGNIINPVASLLNEKVYAIPVIFIIGWRGEPGIHDEPQHVYQGEVTLKLLQDMGIDAFVLSKETTEDEVRAQMEAFRGLLTQGKDVAFVVRKGALSYDGKVPYKNAYTLTREEAIRVIAKHSGDDPVVSTTGKASRELFEIRVANGESHAHDFLTVGSMGHSSSIALGIALQKKDRRVWCIDGDGAVLMHMGALAVTGSLQPENLIHIVINNGAHESVGGMPTALKEADVTGIAKACGYAHTVSVDSADGLDRALEEAKQKRVLSLIEVRCAIGARADLGRPTTTAVENKEQFMRALTTQTDPTIMFFDQYQRYHTTADLIRKMKTLVTHSEGEPDGSIAVSATDKTGSGKTGNTMRILEVGANEHRDLGKELPEDDIYYTDLNLPESMQDDDHCFTADATDLKDVGDNAYDVCVALDVFEHVPAEKRARFLTELYRVCRYGVVISFPYYASEVEQAEKGVNDMYKDLYGEDHPWLAEHIANGLPDREKAEAVLRENGISFTSFTHGNLTLWMKLLILSFFAEEDRFADAVTEANLYYNRNLYAQDTHDVDYRVFYVLEKAPALQGKIANPFADAHLTEEMVAPVDRALQTIIG